MPRLEPIAVSESITVYCPSDGRYSFYNSPYPAHKLNTGLDIYPSKNFGDIAPSPIEGDIIEIRKVKAPKSKHFVDPGYDVVTLVKSRENPERVVKLLHIEPVMDKGDHIGLGEDFGVLLRSGYYGLSTAPHIHLEVRRPLDPLRTRGGFRFQRILKAIPERSLDKLEGTVIHSESDRTYVEFENVPSHGVPGEIGGVPCFIDGGIPVYGWMGAHYESQPNEGLIKLLGIPIARIIKKGKRTCIANCTDFKIKNGSQEVGFFSYLYLSERPKVMLTGRYPGEQLPGKGNEIELTIESH